MRGIAVSGPRRSPLFPDLPTLNEAGVAGYETVAWGGGTPEEFLALVRRETPKWAEVVRRSGAKVD